MTQLESASDILTLRAIISNSNIKILAKIQNHIALKNISEIIDVADGIIIERFALSLDLPPAHLIFVQDYVISKCKLKGKMVILASRIIESLDKKPMPSPSDIADIDLAINQGVDCFEITTELAPSGINVLKEIGKLCIAAEGNINPSVSYHSLEEYLYKATN